MTDQQHASCARTLGQMRKLLDTAEETTRLLRFVVVLERAIYDGRVALPDDLLRRLAETR